MDPSELLYTVTFFSQIAVNGRTRLLSVGVIEGLDHRQVCGLMMSEHSFPMLQAKSDAHLMKAGWQRYLMTFYSDELRKVAVPKPKRGITEGWADCQLAQVTSQERVGSD